MRTLRMGRLGLVLATIAFVGTARPQDSMAEAAAAEQELFRMTNRARAQQGAAQLEWNEWLAQAARKHAAEMAGRSELSHQFEGELSLRERLAATGLHFDASAENVAMAPTTAEIHDDWMRSSGHRANILGPRYNAVGIAVVRSGNEFYAVSDFAHSVPALSAGDLEDAVAAGINQVRARRKLRPLAYRRDSDLRRYACEMARSDRVDPNPLLGRPNVAASLAFTDADPANFSSHFGDVASVATSKAFAVGACFARSRKYLEGTNWIVVTFY